ncbi:phage tail terminator protein [Pediococcus pentosaceus]|uniref:phage tail terminator protein n=1 Tax=Pediococcus pentosaceus TaxID=1255 RepID=UPI0011081680|nr:minor capsid protein [Pediococcus pentosaceus]TLQ02282.1 capsid protein [Pediococcus pentosaceus]
MDLVERLAEKINQLDGLPTPIHIGFLTADNSLQLYPAPGSRTISQDWYGVQERELNFEIAIRTDDAELGNRCLWNISNAIDGLQTLISKDESFEFNTIEMTGLPFISEQDVEGFSIYSLDFKVNIDQQTED